MFRLAFNRAFALSRSIRSTPILPKRTLFCVVNRQPHTVTMLRTLYPKRTMASFPSSVTIKPATTEDGLGITDRAIKVSLFLIVL